MSRRDGAIVAWHAVPGILPPPNQPSRRVRCDWRRCAHRFDDLESRWYLAVSANGPLHRAAAGTLEHHRTRTFQEEYLAFLKKHGAHFDEKELWDYLRPIRPYPTGRFFRGDAFPGTSCQATIGMSLRDRLQSVLSLRDGLADNRKQHLAKACCEMSRRDGAIVAWHEVLGGSVTQKEPSRRVRCDSRRCAHRFDDRSDEISNVIT